MLTWFDFAVNVPAAIRPLSSRELVAAQAVQSETSHEITIRYRPGITAAMRAVYNGRYFNFSRPLNTEERNIELVIPATEGLNDG
ncbi:MAG: head-tail adaptor protein [Herbaspirillum sp.]|nr:head-tail adaptor protein [Herbaspirillum sp.]